MGRGSSTTWGERVIYNLGRSLSAKVSRIIFRGEWKWPRRRSPVIREITENTPEHLIPEEGLENSVFWTLMPDGRFSTHSALYALRASRSVVRCFNIGWFKNHVPRWAIVQWMATHGRLPTRDRLVQ